MSVADRRRQFPDEPWRWNAAWTTGTIVDGTRGGVLVTWAVALFWNAVSTPAVVMMFRDRRAQPWWTYAIVCLFPAVGLGLVWGAIYQTLRVAHFGRSELTLEPFPAHPGEPLNATVRVHASLRDVTAVVAKLQCVRRERRGSGKNESTVNTVLWQDDQPASTVDENGGTRIRATFAPPADARACDDSNRRDVLLWQLVLHGDRPGVDYGATFDLPMFSRRPNDATPPATPFAGGVLPPPAATGLPIDELAAQRIRVRPLAGRGFTVEFPAARRVALASLFTLFAAGCDAIAFFAAKPGGMFGPFERSFAGVWNAMFIVVFTLGFGLIGLALTWVAATMWLARTTLTADRDGLSITRSVLGLARQRTLPPREITGVAPKQTMSSGDRVFYAIELTKSDGKRDLVGSGIEGRGVAERLAAEIFAAIR